MCENLKRCCVWAIVVLICSVGLPAQLAPKVSLLNLRDYGWEAPEPIHPREVDIAGRRSIVIDHEGRVLVGFVVRERTGLVTREQPALASRILRFTPDGKMDLSLSLSTNGWRTNSIYLSDTDQIIARANDNLQFLANSTQTMQRSWKTLAPCAFGCRIWQSPSRRTLLLRTRQASAPPAIISTSALPGMKPCGTTDEHVEPEDLSFQNDPQAITDEFAYHSKQLKSDMEDYFSHKTPVAGTHIYRWPLCHYEHRVALARVLTGFTILNDNLFIANVDTRTSKEDIFRTLEVISPDGQVKFRYMAADRESFWGPIRSSERGDRIAVDVPTIRGRNETLDVSGHVTARRIAVYDIEAGKEIGSIPVSPKHRYRYEFDLSPDGESLAVLEDDIVKVVDLKPAPPVDKPVEHGDTVDLKNGKPAPDNPDRSYQTETVADPDCEQSSCP